MFGKLGDGHFQKNTIPILENCSFENDQDPVFFTPQLLLKRGMESGKAEADSPYTIPCPYQDS